MCIVCILCIFLVFIFSAQFAGLLCEEEGNGADNVQYCGYCKYHFSKLVRIYLEFKMITHSFRIDLTLFYKKSVIAIPFLLIFAWGWHVLCWKLKD